MSDVELIASYWTFAGGALPHSDAEYSTFEFKERCWFLPPGERRTASDERREFLFRACEGLGARHLKVGDFPAQYFLGLELNDGYLKTPAGMEMVTETASHRKLCGYGEFDIKGFTSKLPGSPYRGRSVSKCSLTSCAPGRSKRRRRRHSTLHGRNFHE